MGPILGSWAGEGWLSGAGNGSGARQGGLCASMRTRRGRALSGMRATHVVSGLRTRNISVFCAFNKFGMYAYKAQSRAYNTTTFGEALQLLFDKLRQDRFENVILVLDNVPFHKAIVIQNQVQGAGHRLLFLPPYSPFLNPIENAFSKWKGAVRVRLPQNENQLMEFIDEGGRLITAEDCGGYFRHMLGFFVRCINREEIIDE